MVSAMHATMTHRGGTYLCEFLFGCCLAKSGVQVEDVPGPGFIVVLGWLDTLVQWDSFVRAIRWDVCL